mmetsp:Transcript_17730/g.49615  ORF Transcript_17730/g.49615 Transcript_17730/m.49615 type:complete len:224 (-) Transcript_17730:725-1396(-)
MKLSLRGCWRRRPQLRLPPGEGNAGGLGLPGTSPPFRLPQAAAKRGRAAAPWLAAAGWRRGPHKGRSSASCQALQPCLLGPELLPLCHQPLLLLRPDVEILLVQQPVAHLQELLVQLVELPPRVFWGTVGEVHHLIANVAQRHCCPRGGGVAGRPLPRPSPLPAACKRLRLRMLPGGGGAGEGGGGAVHDVLCNHLIQRLQVYQKVVIVVISPVACSLLGGPC